MGKWSRKNGEEAWATGLRNEIYLISYCFSEIAREDPQFESDQEILVACEEKENLEAKVGGGAQGKRGDAAKTVVKKAYDVPYPVLFL